MTVDDKEADGKGIAMSDPTTTPDNLHNPNDFTAANLANTFPTSPGRPTPNSAKKRRRMPDLSRPTATPGHGAQMSMIFRDAATSLQGSRSHTYPSPSNIKRSRLPLSQARSIKFGSTCQDDTVVSSGLGRFPKISQYLGESCEPGWASSEVSRHWASGSGPHSPTPTPFTKAGCASPETLTNQCLGESTDVGGMCLDDALRVSSASLPSQLEEEGKEPISSGFATPIAPTPSFVENPEEVKYPILENWPSLRSSSDAYSLGSDRDDLHSTHDVPFILPFPHSDAEETQRCHIDTWLNRIVEATTSGHSRSPKQCCSTEDLPMDDAPFSQSIAPNLSSPKRPRVSVSNLKQDLQSPLGASSNKENISPSKSSSSPTHPPAQHPQALTPSHSRQTHSQATLQHTKALLFAHPTTLQGHLSLPPKRKRARVDGIASSSAETEMSTARRDFTIHEDQLAGALAQLSPDVDRHRRGRGPKRERCISYWDEDILQPGSQCVPTDVDGETLEKGKQVLDG
ncbi:hypothetical protein HO173_008213 [Letharia columbiana]|uniref:Uncharacterized protein n=1 Tax=Letharia columbiana TaxID=112416 RepID=A0A8H6L313_9LECA|nr:uncharacterized protein HO173_008213 [Letharia columbiana]KAF6233656.1 hypothetical protein HO173_008213 [Letharia columbiana]